MKTRKLFFALLLVGLVSCGSDNSTSSGSSSSSSSSSTLAQEGNVRDAVSVSDFKSLVANGAFAATFSTTSSCSSGMQRYIDHFYSGFECSLRTSQSDFLWWDDAITSVSNDCDDTTTGDLGVREFQDGTLTVYNGDGTTTSSTKAARLSELSAIVSSASNITFGTTNYGTYNMRYGIATVGDTVYHINLDLPIAANPVLAQEQTSTTSYNGEMYLSSSLDLRCIFVQ